MGIAAPFVASRAAAESVPVPIVLQAELLAKVLEYDRKCMSRETGFGAECAVCWGESINCVSDHCLAPCLGGPPDQACIACQNQTCQPAFHACSGT